MASDASAGNLSLGSHAYELHVPKPRADLLKFSYVYRVVTKKNSLPSERVCCQITVFV